MKTFTQNMLVAFLLMISINGWSQCVVVNNTTPDQTSNNCTSYLADFIPHPNDPVLK